MTYEINILQYDGNIGVLLLVIIIVIDFVTLLLLGMYSMPMLNIMLAYHVQL